MIELEDRTITERMDPEYCCLKCTENPRGDGPCPMARELDGDFSDCDCCDDCAAQCAADV